MISSKKSDEDFMRLAFYEAEKAYSLNEVPVGAIITHKNQIIARAHNLTEQLNDTTAHAEIQAITSATNYIGGKYLKDCTMYVTLEPCVMCAGALAWSQISNLVFGAYDTKRGYSNYTPSLLHNRTTITGGILQEECSELIKKFFMSKR